jgi:hypothetical protein
MVGLAPYADSFFMYLALLICYTIGLKMMFGILAQTLPKKANVQGVGTFLVLLLTLFGGFIVFPDVSEKPKFVQILKSLLTLLASLVDYSSLVYLDLLGQPNGLGLTRARVD